MRKPIFHLPGLLSLNKTAVGMNLFLFAVLFLLFWNKPINLPFGNLCTPLEVRAAALGIIVLVLFQLFLELVKELLPTISIEIAKIQINFPLAKLFKLWKTPDHFPWLALVLLAALIWLIGLGPFAPQARIDPVPILDIVVDYQDGTPETRVKVGKEISISFDSVIAIRLDVPDHPIYSCDWITKNAQISNIQPCMIKYSPVMVTTDLLKVGLRSACSPMISQGSLIIRVLP